MRVLRLSPIVSVSSASGSRNERRCRGPTNSHRYAIRYPRGKTGRHSILCCFVPSLPRGSGGVNAPPRLVLVHVASRFIVDRNSVWRIGPWYHVFSASGEYHSFKSGSQDNL